MKTILRYSSSLGLILLMNFAYALDITGDYLCKGYDPFLKKDYDSDLTINKTGDTYQFDWQETNNAYSGSGLLENNFIATVFSTQGVKKKRGIMFYEVIDKDTLRGQWTYQFTELKGSENCKRIHRPPDVKTDTTDKTDQTDQN